MVLRPKGGFFPPDGSFPQNDALEIDVLSFRRGCVAENGGIIRPNRNHKYARLSFARPFFRKAL